MGEGLGREDIEPSGTVPACQAPGPRPEHFIHTFTVRSVTESDCVSGLGPAAENTAVEQPDQALSSGAQGHSPHYQGQR